VIGTKATIGSGSYDCIKVSTDTGRSNNWYDKASGLKVKELVDDGLSGTGKELVEKDIK
jgi:hypothetical protein